MAFTCDLCGVRSEEETVPLTWSLSLDRGRVCRYCEDCTRANVRSMEGKLVPEHW